jgi:hypothetical protein
MRMEDVRDVASPRLNRRLRIPIPDARLRLPLTMEK